LHPFHIIVVIKTPPFCFERHACTYTVHQPESISPHADCRARTPHAQLHSARLHSAVLHTVFALSILFVHPLAATQTCSFFIHRRQCRPMHAPTHCRCPKIPTESTDRSTGRRIDRALPVTCVLSSSDALTSTTVLVARCQSRRMQLHSDRNGAWPGACQPFSPHRIYDKQGPFEIVDALSAQDHFTGPVLLVMPSLPPATASNVPDENGASSSTED
jgi:hypothetical protein